MKLTKTFISASIMAVTLITTPLWAEEEKKSESCPYDKSSNGENSECSYIKRSLKWSGFLDIRYSTFTPDPSSGNDGNPESGFGLEDGAFYGSYQHDKLSVVTDIPLRRLKKLDSGGSTQESANNTLAIAMDKAQAYLKYQLTPSFTADFGQFDTIYGVELNDSKDRIFNKAGIVYDDTLPVTHTGLMLEYTMGSFGLKLLTANPNNQGSLMAPANGLSSPDYGLALSFGNDLWHAQLGHLYRLTNKASGEAGGSRQLMDLTFGAAFGNLSLDFEYNMITDDGKNTLTAGDTSDAEDAGTGLLALVSYKFGDDWMMGIRAEQTANDPSASSVKAKSSYGLSLHRMVEKNLELRTEYISTTSTDLSDTSTTDTRFNIGTIVQF